MGVKKCRKFLNKRRGNPININAMSVYMAGTDRGRNECRKNELAIITTLETKTPMVMVRIACGGMYRNIALYKPVLTKKIIDAVHVMARLAISG